MQNCTQNPSENNTLNTPSTEPCRGAISPPKADRQISTLTNYQIKPISKLNNFQITKLKHFQIITSLIITIFLALNSIGWGQTGETISYSGTNNQYSTTWTVPAGVTSINIECWGGGGGGGTRTSSNRGGGGGGGGYARKTISVQAGLTVSILIGKGGVAGSAGNNTVATYNGVTSVTANGGGAGNQTTTGGAGGSYSCTGGCTDYWTGASGGGGGGTGNGGGGGGAGAGGPTAPTAGTAGGAAGTGSPAWAGPPTSLAGGNGGAGGGATAGTGVVPGGGGGGYRSAGSSGGAGGNGAVRISYTRTCTAQPTSLTSSSITSTTATISWTAASPAPASGYEYYYSTSSTAPADNATVSGSVAAGVVTANLSSLTASTQYYFWVRSNCGSTKSSWAGSGTFTTTAAACSALTTAQASTPSNQTICSGGNPSSFDPGVASGGSGGTITYQWQSATTNSDANFSNIATSGTSQAYVPPSGLSTTTYYRRKAKRCSGSWEVTSTVFTVTVNADPSISSQPTAGTICVGGTFSPSLNATGGVSGLTYQWQYATSSGGTFNNVSNGTPTNSTYTNQTTNTMSVTGNIAAGSSHWYRCLVSDAGNGCTQATSSAVQLTIVADPGTTNPSFVNQCVGGNTQMTVTGSGGTPSLNYQWYSNSSNSNSGGTLISSATSNSYTPPSSSAGTTYYYCSVSASGSGCTNATSNAAAAIISADPTGFDISKKRVEDMGYDLQFVHSKERENLVQTLKSAYFVIFIADSHSDFLALAAADISFTPANAHKKAKEVSTFALESKGGEGAVDEMVELLRKSMLFDRTL